ncbi:unnamed protein product [Aphanomyces euteiches]
MKSTTFMLVLLGLVCVSFVRADCKACVSFGECTAAYRGAPGQSCGVVAGKTCCCPAAAYCASSSDQCLCKASHGPVLASGSDKTKAVTWMIFVLLIVLGLYLLFRCCCGETQQRQLAGDVRMVKIMRATPTTQTVYGSIPRPADPRVSENAKAVRANQPAQYALKVQPDASYYQPTVYDQRVSENAKAARANQPAQYARQVQPDASYQPWVYVPPTTHHTTSRTYQSSYNSGNTYSRGTGDYSFAGDSGGYTFSGDS